ncbi:hypothetical protein [Dokdonella ginsengisoli]|uniref:Uncharacterized protein n=1 Tax=Dokdonella ginsengisoli TaxID=363846 RepID=A0ABV9QV89_9GAMM
MILRFLRPLALASLAGTSLSAGAACVTTSISPDTALPAAAVGAPYSQTVTASGIGPLPYDFAITSGASSGLGLDLDAVDGTTANLTGTPTRAGRHLFTVTATDTNGCSGGRTYALDVGAGSQTIAFTSSAPSDARFGDTPYNVSAAATSGLAVSFSIDASATAVCAIGGSIVTFGGVGTCVINADQAGDADWNAAPRVQQSFAVGKATQSITFTTTAPTTAVVGGAPYDVAATASSGRIVTFSIDTSAAAVCSIAGSSVSFHSAGTCVINADQAGDANYEPAPQVQQSFAVGRASQTITFTSTAPTAAIVDGAPYAVAATASSGLAVAFSIDAGAASVCSIAGSSVSFHGAGTCVINADQAGDTEWNAAPRVQQSFAVGRGAQTITFSTAAPTTAVVDGPTYAVAATSSSGLAVSFAIDPAAAAVCSIAGATISFHGAGSCVVNADQAGDANYQPAPRAQQSFAVGPGSQSIDFTSTAPANAVVAGAPYTPSASASSGLPVTLTIDAASASVCSIAAGAVSFQHAGTCTIDANQAGDANYQPAPQAQQSFAVGKGNQTVSFTSTAPTDAVVAGATYTPSAVSSAGLPVALTIDASAASVCSISGGVVSFHGAGTCTIDANQAGDADWNAAPQMQQSFAVGKGSQTISFTSTAPTDAHVGGTYTVAATATSGLPVAFSIDPAASGVCSIAGDTVSFVGGGTCVIDADQAGDANWNAAARVQQSFTVSTCVTLAVGQVVLDVMPGGANFCVDNAEGANAEFTYLPINIAASGEVSLGVTGTGIVAVAGPPTPIAPTGASPLAPLQEPAEPLEVDYHAVETPAFPPEHVVDAASLIPPYHLNAGPLTVGQLIDLNAAVGGCSVAPDVRKARVEAITTPQTPGQQVLYAVQEVVETTPGAGDWHPPVPGGYGTPAFQAIIDAFVQAPPGSTASGGGLLGGQLKTGMMNTFTGLFGDLTDVDNNGGVIVFFTPKLNELSPPASSALQVGLFQPRDLFSAASCPSSNEAEILYLMVPDPTGVVNSNVRTVSFAYGNAGPTLVHHFEHLFNAARRIYFNSAPTLEEPWLDEALAWSAQELAFFNASVGLVPRSNLVVTNLTTGPNASVRVAAFNTYENPMYGAMRTYFLQLGGSNGNKRLGPLRRQAFTSGLHDATAQNFAHTYMFLRYAIDRKNTGDAALFNALVNTTQAGVANLQAVFGADPNEWMRDFLIAAYADDAVAGVDARYTLPSWNIRSLYSALNGSYPLATDPLSNAVPLTFALSPGGGTRYVRFGVAPGQSASLTLTEGGVSPTSAITTALVRTK